MAGLASGFSWVVGHSAALRLSFKRIGRGRASRDASPLAGSCVWVPGFCLAERDELGEVDCRLIACRRIEGIARGDLNFDNTHKIAFLGGTQRFDNMGGAQ
jgi:hypothetical protein